MAAAFDRPPPPDGSEIELGQGLSSLRRAREQSAQLSRLREHVVAPVVELPFLFVPALGPEELGRLAVPLGAALG